MKKLLDENTLLGRKHTAEEYSAYVVNHPSSALRAGEDGKPYGRQGLLRR